MHDEMRTRRGLILFVIAVLVVAVIMSVVYRLLHPYLDRRVGGACSSYPKSLAAWRCCWRSAEPWPNVRRARLTKIKTIETSYTNTLADLPLRTRYARIGAALGEE